ncbi:hypothetical protein MPTK1_6g07360 [Marchantia polymorpha subsp. ruderalis]|uniref:Uncharacterized protein n=2 Tax=Marchantia polymorpha TaxID=3197 RepID=A0AAF6BPH5_MARPO|nr:hypothetical protein MARPO_0053s0050 [Marchantia polymorpha]BBN13909.1 hypothetical protein Mp_6g07360 [Marchantia polymorpha subsp. ruderalis]|eukprot:PTQ38111.1 hypothetical protein MARPO_0053s0050 [Marchantia polymorpha]
MIMRMLSCIFVLLGAILTHLPAHGLRLSTRERDPDAEQPKYNVSAVSLLQNETHDDVGEKHLLPAEDGDNFHSLEQNSVRSGYDKVLLYKLYQETPHHDQETNSKWLLDERGLFYYKVPIGYVIVKPWV